MSVALQSVSIIPTGSLLQRILLPSPRKYKAKCLCLSLITASAVCLPHCASQCNSDNAGRQAEGVRVLQSSSSSRSPRRSNKHSPCSLKLRIQWGHLTRDEHFNAGGDTGETCLPLFSGHQWRPALGGCLLDDLKCSKN